MTLAEIMADIERQARNYGTVILPTDDAMRLRAVARAAVEIRDRIRHDDGCPWPWNDVAACDCGVVEVVAAFDAVAGEVPK